MLEESGQAELIHGVRTDKAGVVTRQRKTKHTLIWKLEAALSDSKYM